jgi:chemotaxis response regulator CheB
MTSQPHKRVVVLESDYLLSAGVQSFLSNQEHLEVMGLDAKDPQESYQAILQIQPDVIILDQNNQLIDLNALLEHLEDLPRVRTVVMSYSDDQVQVYDRNKISIHQLSDFLAVI